MLQSLPWGLIVAKEVLSGHGVLGFLYPLLTSRLACEVPLEPAFNPVNKAGGANSGPPGGRRD